jgi:hypothetical protein
MNPTVRNLLLSVTLIAVPASGFALAEIALSLPAQTADRAPSPAGLGDLSAYKAIVTDTQGIVASGDLKAAEHRITDLETLWDQNASALRKADRAAWNSVDGAADDAFSALRASAPDKAAVETALENLARTLDAPVPVSASSPVQYVAGIAVTDGTGRALPCEEMIGQVRQALGGTTPAAAVADLQSRALERCNADDDAHADAFSAQALAQIKG